MGRGFRAIFRASSFLAMITSTEDTTLSSHKSRAPEKPRCGNQWGAQALSRSCREQRLRKRSSRSTPPCMGWATRDPQRPIKERLGPRHPGGELGELTDPQDTSVRFPRPPLPCSMRAGDCAPCPGPRKKAGQHLQYRGRGAAEEGEQRYLPRLDTWRRRRTFPHRVV